MMRVSFPQRRKGAKPPVIEGTNAVTNRAPRAPGHLLLSFFAPLRLCGNQIIHACLALTLVVLSAAGVSSVYAQTNYSQFKHDNPQHARLPCLLCHRRDSNSPQPTLPGKASHAPCTGCHQQQFANAASEICSICHTDAQSGKMKPFPPLRSFNVRFDHAKHAGTECGSCHRRNRGGVALSIPARMNAHVTCFGCHTPGAKPNGRDISSCSTCHQLGRFVRTSEQAAAYRVGFSHAKHDASESLSCVECHKVRPGLPQGRQVTAPVALNHRATRGTSCASCHNGQRAFGGDDFSVCKQCHKGSAWRF
ncbi:MAG TPA: cytochrome c3 family protein [Pyrinomonadaceae bacterium]|jgi:c(7)-type cytochrome triheme protein|nr:cytochrome c3 family protein [Pyrinomonadaceae bacterium]